MLVPNDILVAPDGARFRLLAILVAEGQAYVFPLQGAKPTPQRRSLLQLQQLVDAGDWKVQEPVASAAPFKVSAAAIARRDKAWSLIEPLVNDPAILEPASRAFLVDTRAAACRVSRNRLWRHLRSYWAGGQSRLALTPGFDRCGRRAPGQRARGRRPSKGSQHQYVMEEADVSLCREALQRHYVVSGQKETLQRTYQRMLEAHYSYLDGNGNKVIKPRGERPTITQFRYVFRTHFSTAEVREVRKGAQRHALEDRPVPGSLTETCPGIGHTYEIDATIVDVFIVSKDRRDRIIGKPTLYLVVDRKSRLIVGSYLGLESPSWVGARLALLNIAEDKAVMCRRYGVAYDPADWPAHGLYPVNIVADRGDMISKASDAVVEGLGITLSNLPTSRADWKPNVEGAFKLVQTSIKSDVPGYDDPANFGKRGRKRGDKDSALTLDELYKLILSAIILRNNTSMDGYRLPLEMSVADVVPTPLNIWGYEAANHRTGFLRRYAHEHVALALLEEDTARVNRQGIYFHHRYYWAKRAEDDGWFHRGEGKGVRLTVAYDRRLLDQIYVYDEKAPGGFFVATLAPAWEQFKGMSHQEVEFYKDSLDALHREGEQNNRQEALEHHERTEDVIREAKREMKEATKGKTRHARKKDIKPDRVAEQAARGKADAAAGFAVIAPDAPVERETKGLTLVYSASPAPQTQAPPAVPAEPIAPPPLSAPPAAAPLRAKSLQEIVEEQRRKLLNGQ